MFSSNTSQVSGDQVFIEDVFSTWLYTGTGSSLTINNGIDLSTKGGLVWGKDRTNNASNHILIDTNRWSAGNNALLYSNLTNSQQGYTQAITAFSTTGFTLGTGTGVGGNNASGTNYVSWTFRKQPKFFDVVTWTGTGAAPHWISHSLGVVPGCVIIKATSATGLGNWFVVHRSTNGFGTLQTDQGFAGTTFPGIAASSPWLGATTTQIDVQSFSSNGGTYVAYLFAHNAGGFGLTGTDNVISCGSFTTDASSKFSVSLGYEPQWLLLKSTSQDFPESWYVVDTMRGFAHEQFSTLSPNSSAAEAANNSNYVFPTATGFASGAQTILGASREYIYIAIRRGPMKTPTTGTSVFSPNNTVFSSSHRGTVITTGFPVDMQLYYDTINASYRLAVDRLRGANSTTGGGVILVPPTTGAETSLSAAQAWDNTSFQIPSAGANTSTIYWSFRRAPGFFDVVCWTGDGVFGRPMPHNLGVVPELIIFKTRTQIYAVDWVVWQTNLGGSPPSGLNYLYLNSSGAISTSYQPQEALPTSSQLNLRPSGAGNASGFTYVAYLFASCPGVSKVGSYTGNGSSQTIDCGFTGGARFFLVKRTDSTGDWWVYDSARGITAPADPALRLNSTAAEVTSADAVDPTSVGIVVNQEATCNINVSSATYIYLAIA